MEIPEGAKFMFIAIPLVIVASVLILVYMGKDDTGAVGSKNNLSEENMMDISQGNSLTDFDELKTEITVEGDGPSAGVGDGVVVHYTGTLRDGTKFDSSLDRGTPFEFVLGDGMVISGWEEGVKGMKVGEKRTLYIPSSMGYGDMGVPGVIPGGSGLVFEVELLEIK